MKKNSIRQMLRMPIKTGSFLVLIAAMGFLVSLALGIFVKTSTYLKIYQNQFKTIGTVSQLASSVSQDLEWNAEKKEYEIRQKQEYGHIIPISVLDFEGAEYIHAPEKRNYYGSYSPEYQLLFDGMVTENPIIEFSPVEDCTPDHSVKIEVKRVLLGSKYLTGTTLWYCDHFTELPDKLYRDKTYVAALLFAGWTHDKASEEVIDKGEREVEYFPVAMIAESYDRNGKRCQELKKEEEIASFYELTDDFYEKPEGRRYLHYSKALEMLYHTFPVTGTDSTDLLLPFYLGNAYIAEGRDISEDAYNYGLNECLISEAFAGRNAIKVGDNVKAQLYFTNSSNSAAKNFMQEGALRYQFSLLVDDGLCPQVFETKEYTVVGIYASARQSSSDVSMGGDEMIVPQRSIENKDVNIRSYGPLKNDISSFEIPNGSIEAYMKKWEALGIKELEFTFYDKGYTKLEKGMKNMRFMAVLFGMIGILLGITLLIFYSRTFVGGQKLRVTIERCMGVTDTECKRSLLTSAILVLLIGSIIGCTIGTIFTGNPSIYNTGTDFYDMTFSNGSNALSGKMTNLEMEKIKAVLCGIFCELIIFITGYIILQRDIKVLLKQEPLYLLKDVNTE